MAAFPIRKDTKLPPSFPEEIADEKINRSGKFQRFDSIIGTSTTNDTPKIEGSNVVKKELSYWSEVRQEDFGVKKELSDWSDVEQEEILDCNFAKKKIFDNDGSDSENAGGDGDKNTSRVTYEPPSLCTTSEASEPERVFVLSGCRGCMNYIMAVEGTVFCFKCGGLLFHFDWD